MNKTIALFSDGTGNSASTAQKTNVWRAYQALDRSDGRSQIAYYDNGVGTSPFTPMAIIGLAFGFGVARNVRQIYGFLCRTYNEGDEIYGFGFSRGAFTMRVAVALIASQGIIDRNLARDDRDLDRLVAAAYRNFRSRDFTPSLLSFALGWIRDGAIAIRDRLGRRTPYDPARNLRYTANAGNDSLITFLGVWDSVDAYGFPVDEFIRAWDMVVWPLSAKDRDLSPRVARACHALALDEQRESFEPMLWNEDGIRQQDRIGDERLSQVWFPGVHANVGGGYPDDGLAFVALDWMIGQCEELTETDPGGKQKVSRSGLRFVPAERERIRACARIDAPLYDSRSGVGNLYRYAPRHIEQLCDERKAGLANWLKEKLGLSRLHAMTKSTVVGKVMGKMGLGVVHRNEVRIDRPKIHHTVFDRIVQSGTAYAPINLPGQYAYVDDEGRVIDIGAQSAAQTALPETTERAAQRRQRQSYVWNRVFGRKLLYFVTLVAIISFVSYPYWAGGNHQEGNLEERLIPVLGTFSAVVQQIPMMIGNIPGLGFAENWAVRYQPFPFIFLLGILAIGGLLLASAYVNRLLKAGMRRNWFWVTASGGRPAADVGGFTKWLARFLEGPVYTNLIARPLRLLLEAGAFLILLVLLAAVANRLLFVSFDAGGGICPDARPADNPAFGAPLLFDPSDACFDTGLSLEKGKTYEIKLVVSDWKDKGIDADVKGWCQDWCINRPPLYLHLLVPLRRHLFADWYQPMARIDNRLLDRYPLTVKDADPGKEQRELVTEITPHRSGELYLYLNDAVLFGPGGWQRFYANNNGSARVTVRKVEPEPSSP